jgi:predicted MFS family arabinose efflux permease
MVSAAGSLGAMIAAPIGQTLSAEHGWRWGVLGFALLALVMLPAAWVAGRADKVPLPAPAAGTADGSTARQVVRQALHHRALRGDGAAPTSCAACSWCS